MTIDFWSLGLQAVNVLILVWLLSRVFWRPVAGAIAKRQDAARSSLEDARITQKKAEAALAELTSAREGIAAEREAVLAEAAKTAAATSAATLEAAREKSASLIAAAQAEISRDREAAEKEQSAQAAELAVEIAAKLLDGLNSAEIQNTFLESLVEALSQMSADDRAALAATKSGIELVSATEPDETQKSEITNAVRQALGSTPKLTFVTDPSLIAGLEIRTKHFELRNSWQLDLARILKELKSAA
jgi:F-type H+-transporting ATPase subunit b